MEDAAIRLLAEADEPSDSYDLTGQGDEAGEPEEEGRSA